MTEVAKLVKKIKAQTARNFHTNALKTLVEAFDVCEEFRADVKQIAAAQKRDGYLSSENSTRRYEVLKGALAKVKTVVTEKEYNALYMSF